MLATTSVAEEPVSSSLESRCAPIVQPILDVEYPGYLEVRVYKDGERFSKTYNCPTNEPPIKCGESIYEIASISKVLTGVILAHFVGDGSIKLDYPIQQFLPDGVKVPKVGEHEITIRDLATHSSGLPRMPGNFREAKAYDPKNPYATYTREELFAFLSQCAPERAPGEAYEYSNFGVAILGNILELKSGKPYETLLQEYICATLGLKNFSVQLNAKQREHFVSGYNKNNRPAEHWDLGVFAAAGGIRATADDLMAFALAGLAESETPLHRAFQLSMREEFIASENLSMALCWHINKTLLPSENVYWHNGETGGFHSYMAVVPESKLAVVVLGNVATDKIDEIGVGILKSALGK